MKIVTYCINRPAKTSSGFLNIPRPYYMDQCHKYVKAFTVIYINWLKISLHKLFYYNN